MRWWGWNTHPGHLQISPCYSHIRKPDGSPCNSWTEKLVCVEDLPWLHHKKRVWWHCCQLWAWQSCYNTRNKRYYLLTICFDYLWVVFFSSFQQEIQLRIRKHSNKYQLLNNTFSFCICMFQTENPDSYEKPQGWWCSQLQFFYYGVPTFSNLKAHLSVCSIIT